MKHITEIDLNGIPLVVGQSVGEALVWDGTNWVNQVIATAQNLNQTLNNGNNTGGININITPGDTIVFNDSGFTTEIFPNTLAGNTTVTLPSTTGTLALLTDIPAPIDAWLGNGNTEGVLKTLGTLDNFDLPFITNNIERARILASNGNFGIGTTTPDSKIQVVVNDNSYFQLHLRNNNENQASGIKLSSLSDQFHTYLYRVGATNTDLNADYRRSTWMAIGLSNGVNEGHLVHSILPSSFSESLNTFRVVADAQNGTVGFSSTKFIVTNKGRVGINLGTTIPTANLQVQGTDLLSTSYTAKFQNSSGIESLIVNNAGKVGVTEVESSWFNVASNATGLEHFRLSGSDFYGVDSQSQGVSFLLGVNTGNNRQMWLADSDSLTKNSTNTVLAFQIGGTTEPSVNAISTSGLVYKNFTLQTNGGNLGIGTQADSPAAKTHIRGIDGTTFANLRLEPVTKVIEDTLGSFIVTTDAVTTMTADTITTTSDSVICVTSTVTYRKTAGAGLGTVGDGTAMIIRATYKNVGGTVTLTSAITAEFVGTPIGLEAVTFDISGTTVRVRVTGLLNNTILWNSISKVTRVTS